MTEEKYCYTVKYVKLQHWRASQAIGLSIAVDASGNVYLGGRFAIANLTTPALTKIGFQDACAFRLDSAGTSVWSKNFGGSGAQAFGQSIAVDASGNVYLGGYFDNANLTTPALTRIGNTDGFIIKRLAANAVVPIIFFLLED